MITLGAAAMVFAGCAQNNKEGKPAIDLANFDLTTAPSEDFYQYACGGWMEANPLTPEYARYGIFDQLEKENNEKLKALIEELGSTPQKPGSVGEKIRMMYEMGLDSLKRNADGAAPVMEQLAAINAVSNHKELSAMAGRIHVESASPFFGFYIGADEKNSTMNLLQFYQGGISMSDRDYYLLEDESTVKIRNAYRQYIDRLFVLAGYTAEEAAKAADAVLALETEIAKVSVDRATLRDVHKNYNKITIKEFTSKYDFLDWNEFFRETGISKSTELNAGQIPFFEGLTKLLKKTSLEDQKLYLSFKLLNAASSYLSDDFVNANFDFYGRALQGKEELQPRWKSSLAIVNRSLAEAFGQMYVEKYFPASSKEKMIEMVANLQTALGERIEALEWMSEQTKSKAQEKLGTFIVKVGYPDNWKDYTALEIKNDSYWANICRTNVFAHNDMMEDEGQPVDRTEWGMSPQTVNAYYNPTTNEICFPAAILQPPFFNPDADDAVNYGAIGVVIGHEMTHGFDDQGREFDKDGNMANWWTEADAAAFKERTDILVDQFNKIVILPAKDGQPALMADGALSLGENIADQGGLRVAYTALQNTFEAAGEPEPIDGFTAAQRFYISYATIWGQNIRDEEAARLTKVDVHSLGKNRVNATLRNIQTFYDAFGITDGAMFLPEEERVVIW